MITATENQPKTNSKINDALELLNEAAKEKKEEFKGLLTDKYSHIKQAMVAAAFSLLLGYLMGSKRR